MKKKFVVEVEFKDLAPGQFQVSREVLVNSFKRRFEGYVMTLGTCRATITSAQLCPETSPEASLSSQDGSEGQNSGSGMGNPRK